MFWNKIKEVFLHKDNNDNKENNENKVSNENIRNSLHYIKKLRLYKIWLKKYLHFNHTVVIFY